MGTPPRSLAGIWPAFPQDSDDNRAGRGQPSAQAQGGEKDGEGGVVLDGRAEIRYIIDDDDDMDDDNVYGYLESYAPF